EIVDESNNSKDNKEDYKTDNITIKSNTTNDNDNLSEINDNKLGYNHETNTLMPGFEDIQDELLSFTSESDFKIFNRQISSDIPLQRLVAVKRLSFNCHRFGIDASLSLIPRIKNVATDKEMVIRQTCAE